MPNFPVYFLHTTNWASFWKESNNQIEDKHDFVQICSTNQFLKATVYKYPWQLGQNFLYLSKGPYLDTDKFNLLLQKKPNTSVKSFLQTELRTFFQSLLLQAKDWQTSYIKFDFDDHLAGLLELKSNEDLLDLSKTLIKELSKTEAIGGAKVKTSNKTIQYMATMVLDLRILANLLTGSSFSAQSLESFWQESQDFWQTTNQNIRRYTKKSLQAGWQVSTEKTTQNFEAYWEIYTQTSSRQNFAIQPKDYLQNLFNQPFSRIIILRDEQNQPQCVWLGIVIDRVLYYLSGGNSEVSFNNYGQYLIHLAAVKLATTENALYYDLGGYDPALSFSKFKDNYKGSIRQFLGPIDILIKPNQVSLTNFVIFAGKAVQNLKSKLKRN